MNPKILEIDGWMAPEELTWLYETARKVPPSGLIVEIGAWQGRSSAAIYEGAGKEAAGVQSPNKIVVSIDTWQGQDDLPDHQIAKEVDMFQIYLANIKALGFSPLRFPFLTLRNRNHYLINDSVNSAVFFDDKSIDWIFIDGDHRLCGADIDAYLPKMKADGLITGHDYFCFYETIQQEIHKRFYIHEIHYSIWVRYIGLSKPWWY